MKIALVSPYDFAYPGGVVNHISALERCFTAMGHTVKVIAPISKAVSVFGDRFIPMGSPRSVPSSGSVCRVTISLKLAKPLKEVFAREHFDIVHVHEPFMPMLCTAVLRFSPYTNVGTFHACAGNLGYYFGWPVTAFMIRQRARKLHGHIAVSEAARSFAAQNVPGKYAIIPNGIDTEHFTPDVMPLEQYADGKLNILFVGRLEGRKGVPYLLKAYQQVKKEVPQSRLIIVGPGKRMRQVYERQVSWSGLKDVVFVGFSSYEDLPRYYKTADVFCAPATGRESFGIVLLESMAVSCPIVATNIAGYANVVKHGAEGLLVPPRDDESLARALVCLLTDSGLRRQMGAQGRLKARGYCWENVSQRVMDYYTSVIDKTAYREAAVEVGAGAPG